MRLVKGTEVVGDGLENRQHSTASKRPVTSGLQHLQAGEGPERKSSQGPWGRGNPRVKTPEFQEQCRLAASGKSQPHGVSISSSIK